MKAGLVIPVLMAGVGFIVTWGCSSSPDPDTGPLLFGANVQALVLDYAHGAYPAGAMIDVECIDDGRQGSHETGEGCDCLHLHSGAGINIVGSTATVADMEPNECGHGCLVVTATSALAVYCGGLDVDDPNHPRKGLCLQAPCGN